MATVTDEKLQVDDRWGVDWVRVRLNESFEELSALNPDLRVEQESNGEFVFMSPTGGESSSRNMEIAWQLMNWTKRYGGVCFDSSVIFCLPDGSNRSPDASWIAADRWIALASEDRKKFPPIAPDFVIELRSETDRLSALQDKMTSYIKNGVRLGWLIDPMMKQVHIYRPNSSPDFLTNPETVSAQDVLPGFVLDLRSIFQTMEL
ncbi:MAG: Uma2 family endonuclease [Pirellulaceae bacterium]|nr:Uma2 family endonuclease [Pirellulaceae bacterium]